jgi:hypothetical protein
VVKDCMESAVALNVPLQVKLKRGKQWSSMIDFTALTPAAPAASPGGSDHERNSFIASNANSRVGRRFHRCDRVYDQRRAEHLNSVARTIFDGNGDDDDDM